MVGCGSEWLSTVGSGSLRSGVVVCGSKWLAAVAIGHFFEERRASRDNGIGS